MQHNRTARPTIRLLQEDLKTDWGSVDQRRAVGEERWMDLHPFADIDHPIIRKAADQLGSDPIADASASLIHCSGPWRLQEVRMSQWRAGIWTDPDTGVRWTATAGLAKGNHEDHDDFYEQLTARVSNGGGAELLPTAQDQRLLARETMASALTAWELDIQANVETLLTDASVTGSARIEIFNPLKSDRVVVIEVTIVVRNDPDCDYEEVVVEFGFEPRYRGSEIGWTVTERTLISISPPVQGWDRFHDTFSVINEIGHLGVQLGELRTASSRGELLLSVPGDVSHYAHRRHLAESTVLANGVRSLCGSFFVPMQDHDALPLCPACTEIYEKLA